jgi:hypothetical protein
MHSTERKKRLSCANSLEFPETKWFYGSLENENGSSPKIHLHGAPQRWQRRRNKEKTAEKVNGISGRSVQTP